VNNYFYKKLREKSKKYCRLLDIPTIKIYSDIKDNVCFECTLSGKRKILIDEFFIKWTIKKHPDLFAFKKHNLNSITKRLYFMLGHEIGHYYTFIKHPKYFWKNESEDKNNKFNAEEYRKLKLEKIADKIALYLLKIEGAKK